QEQMLPGNFGRYENDEAWDLVQELSRTAQDEPEYQEIMSQLQEITMTELPMIPLWYNGMWAQYNTQVWTNWPTSDPSTPDYFPVGEGSGFHQGGLHTLAKIEPAGSDPPPPHSTPVGGTRSPTLPQPPRCRRSIMTERMPTGRHAVTNQPSLPNGDEVP